MTVPCLRRRILQRQDAANADFRRRVRHFHKLYPGGLYRWKAGFLELEGIDIYSAAAVAVASLEEAVKDGSVKKDEVIMLNITGGGEKLAKSHKQVVYAVPDLVLDPALPSEEIINRVEKLF